MASMFLAGFIGAVIYASPLLTSEDDRTVFAVWSDVPLILGCGLAFFRGSRDARAAAERRFWRLWLTGIVFWLLVHALDIVHGGAVRMSQPLQLVRNLVYMGLYLAAAMSFEQRPDIPRPDARSSPYRMISGSGAVVLVFGMFTYLALIPAALGPGRSQLIVSRALLFLVLDAYLLMRLAFLTRQAASSWRGSYAALLAAVLLWTAADAGEALARTNLMAESVLSFALDALWLPPFIALAVAARLRARRGPVEAQERTDEGRFPARPRGSVLASVMLVPAVHLFLEGIGAFPAATLGAQRLCALSVFVALGLLAFAHQRQVERDLRESTSLLAHTNTELKRKVDELATARDLAEAGSQAKLRFLANTSHEIRTPMNGVLGMAELLLKSGLSGSQRRLVTTLKRSAESLLAIIDDILDFSRVDAGRLELDPVEIDVREVAGDVAELLAPRARAKGLVLSCLVEDVLPRPLKGDPGRLRQILLNLVGNAVKFTERGEVEIRVRLVSESESSARIAFDVRDTGIGISEAFAPRIFDEFLQADGSMSRRYGGTGLGLAISRRLAALMDGTISFESEAGRGSTFHLVAQFGKVAGSMPGPSRPEETRGRPVSSAMRSFSGRVLAVEDDAVNQAVIEGLLSSWGLNVDLAGDGRAALAALERERYDLVFMDCMMPGMDGFEATEEIRRREAATPGRRTPVVALTASAMAGDRERCLAAGMDDYLGKPVRTTDLLALLERWLPSGPPPPASFAGESAAGAEIGPAGLTEPLDAEALEGLRTMTKDGAPLLARVLDLYRETAPARLLELREALSRGDAPALRASAHSLKSSSANVGARNLALLCRVLEEGVRKGNVHDPSPGVAAIEAEYERVSRAIEALKEGSSR